MIEGISSSLPSFIELSGSSTNSDSNRRKDASSFGYDKVSSEKDTDATGLRLTPEQKQEVEELKKRDQEVRTHEQAHMAIGGSLASSASYKTLTGPDNKQYATGGEVQIDTSPVEGDPEKSLEKARKIRSAAMAPANPSSQDMQVAAQASQIEAQARQEKAQKQNGEDEKINGNKKLSNQKTYSPSMLSGTITSASEEKTSPLSLNRLLIGLAGPTNGIDGQRGLSSYSTARSASPQSVANLYERNSLEQKNENSLSITL